MVRILLVLLFASGAAFSACAEQPCSITGHSEVVSPDAGRLAPAAFEGVRLDMTMWEIVKFLGPANRELGSGLIIFAWDSTDGREFVVGGPSMCEPPLYARFDSDAPSDTSPEYTRE